MNLAPFAGGCPGNTDEDSYYDLPSRSETAISLYEHCARAILTGLQFGEHGLPFIGSSGWKDGVNLVGICGKGDSVWLGFFLKVELYVVPPISMHSRRTPVAAGGPGTPVRPVGGVG